MNQSSDNENENQEVLLTSNTSNNWDKGLDNHILKSFWKLKFHMK